MENLKDGDLVRYRQSDEHGSVWFEHVSDMSNWDHRKDISENLDEILGRKSSKDWSWDKKATPYEDRGPQGPKPIEDQLVELTEPTNPVVDYRLIVDDSGQQNYMNRVMIGTATTGLVRVEWVGARYTVTVPVNWSQVEMTYQIPTYMPLRYQVADAQNMIVREALFPRGKTDGAFEWLLLLEHDVVVQSNVLVLLNEYLQEKHVPIISGLYFTRSIPSLPLVFRGRGNGVYTDWKLGDKVYCDGVPTGLLMIHTSILKLMWDESPEYMMQGNVTRRVFNTPREVWHDPQSGRVTSRSGTSDLQWCNRIMEGEYIQRAGWGKYWDELPDKRYPFLLDTNLFARHIEKDGQQFPPQETLNKFIE